MNHTAQPAAPGRPTKSVRIGGAVHAISGISPDDAYFAHHVADDFEPGFARLLDCFVAPDMNCVDLGANIGMKSLLLSRHAAKGRVIAVEAGPAVFAVLRHNIAQNQAANVTPVHCAVSDHDGEVRFADNSAWGHIDPGGAAVPARRLATLLNEQRLDRLDFLKIDVEGHEFTLLRDALDTINAHRALVLFEFNALVQVVHAETSPLAFARWILESFAFVYLVRKDGSLRRVARDGAVEILHVNMVHDACVTDLLVTNAPERLMPLALELDAAARALVRERDEARAEAEAARAEAIAARAEAMAARAEAMAARADAQSARDAAAAMRASRSWRLTSALRQVRRGMS